MKLTFPVKTHARLVSENHPPIQYEIVRSAKRRSTSLQVSLEKGVRVLAPVSVSQRWIETFVQKKAAWILSCQTRQKNLASRLSEHQFIQHEQFRYRGGFLVLHVEETLHVRRPHVSLLDQSLHVVLPVCAKADERATRVRDALHAWYMVQAEALLAARTAHFAEIMKVKPRSVSIGNQKTLWGSCSASGAIRYNWRIMMAPDSVIDYLVVHELAHLLVRGHSKKFWRVVLNVLPDTLDRRAILKRDGALYRF